MARIRSEVTLMKILKLLLAFILAMPAMALAQGKLNVITTVEDLAAIAREVGGDRISVESIARGYQDPHFVEAKPSFILKLQKADVLIVVGRDDSSAVALTMAEKIANLRIFQDDQGKMNRSLLEVNGSALVVSQFTLYGDARGQRRPSFIGAAPPEQAKDPYEEFSEGLRRLGVIVATGVFQAMMSVELVNEGPVTILLDSDKRF